MASPPIAIIGRGCALPGALNIKQFNELVMNGRMALSKASAQNWQANDEDILQQLGAMEIDSHALRMGGLVKGFDEVFDSSGLMVDSQELQGDVISRWMIHVGRQALQEAGFTSLDGLPKTGMIMGNLSYPTVGHGLFGFHALMSQQKGSTGYDLDALLKQRPVHYTDRFSTSLPVATAARALGCKGESFALDAACASSLYAIKLACDRLHNNECDLMLAGAVNHCDNLLLHIGFTALGAHSPTGRSLPFQQEADGLLPGEGAAMFALCRLDDAIQNNWPVLGLIRGIGLSNDGQRGGFLQPDSRGQAKALKMAYQQAELDPASISYVECHATGTILGDQIELETLKHVYKDIEDLPIGSLKANLGHLISVAGSAGLLKLLAALETETLPQTPISGTLVPELEKGPLRLVTQNESWQQASPRRAGLNAFGFGGSNAHLIIEEWCEDRWRTNTTIKAPITSAKQQADDLAIVSMAVQAGQGQSTHEFIEQLFDKPASPQKFNNSYGFPSTELQVDLKKIKTPPNDLHDTLGQHILILLTALDAVDDVALDPEKTGIYIGMGCDSEMSRFVIRSRLGYLVCQLTGEEVASDWLETASDELTPQCRATHILGGMPNMPATRINRLLDIKGPGFTIGAEENSGLTALHTAQLALQAGEIDMAIVGAVDLSCETIHQHAASMLLPGNRQVSGDAATVLVLRRLNDAKQDGDDIIAVIPSQPIETNSGIKLQLNKTETGLTSRFGHAHACSGLLMITAAAAAIKHGIWLQAENFGSPWLQKKGKQRIASIDVTDLTQQHQQVCLHSAENSASGFDPNELQLFCYAANDRASLILSLQSDKTSEIGTFRLALVCSNAQREEKIQVAIEALEARHDPSGESCFYAEQAVEGEVAFVFNGIAASYSGVSRELTMAVPQLFARLEQRCDSLDVFPQVLEPGYNAQDLTPLEQIFASILYGQLHTEWTQGIAAIQPQAMIGISAGETNSLFAARVWQDLGGMFRRLKKWDIFDSALSNPFDVVTDAWRDAGVLGESENVSYSTWRVFHPVDDLLERIADVEPLVRVSIIHNDQDCIIVGQQQACKSFLDQLSAKAIHLGEGISIHTPDIEAFSKTWYDLHHWPTQQVDDIRLYSNAHHGSYKPTQDSVAEALTQQAISSIDYRPTIKQAYADGVRIFIEHGARNLCSNWISDILDERPHISVAMDVPGKNSYQQALEVIAQLWSVQVPVDLAAVHASMPNNNYKQTSEADSNPTMFSMPAHMPEVTFPPLGLKKQISAEMMPIAPPLPLTTEHWQPTTDLMQPVAMAVEDNNNTKAYIEMSYADNRLEDITAMHQNYLQSITYISANMARSLQTFQTVLGQEERQPDSYSIQHLTDITNNTFAAAASQVVQTEEQEPVSPDVPALPGPKWGRKELEVLASDKISKVFGKLFERQDDYHRQVRMPMPPLLLADRVTGIDAEPGSLGNGTIWTETDVDWSCWYLHEGHMPAGIMVESGQADLLLISYLGADFVNRDDRVYRLLGCELTFHGGLAKPGDTLKYEIHIDGHTQHAGVRLFFFHYDCYINGEHRISVRNGQAGFFTDEELDNSEGILWQAEEIGYDPAAIFDKPVIGLNKQQLSDDEISRFCAGDLTGCFGGAFAFADTHTRTPSIPAGQLRLLDRVTKLQHDGGPCGRGYLRAELDLQADHWFYLGHFKNDPCMPGTLMAEGCYQAMAIYLSSLGFSLDKDGWRFEPVPNHIMLMSCRGQATPKNKKLLYEIFVTSITQSPQPMLIADILCTVDGLKAFHGKGAALQLVPGWPLEDQAMPALTTKDRYAAVVDDIYGNSHAMLACAQGRPSMAFGHRIAHFDQSGLRPPRLPAPPYLFISRATGMPEQPGTMQAGGEIVAELDIHSDDWFFAENGAAVMPYCVLLEATLQPCGWLASFCIANADDGEAKHEMVFRNLDGKGTVHGEVTPAGGTLVTAVKHTRISESSGMIILSFEVSCRQGKRPIYDFNTVFGFFPPTVMAQQAGLEAHPLMSQLLEQDSDFNLSLLNTPARYFHNSCRLATDKLMVLDRITGFWAEGGSKGLGALRSEKIVHTDDWFFKAHFFQDPVQPGSLGLEAMIQLLQFYMLHTEMDKTITQARFEAIATKRDMEWKYRGQVSPYNKQIEVTMDITDRGTDQEGTYAVADASLWVDGLRIYHATRLTMRVVGAEPKS